MSSGFSTGEPCTYYMHCFSNRRHGKMFPKSAELELIYASLLFISVDQYHEYFRGFHAPTNTVN